MIKISHRGELHFNLTPEALHDLVEEKLDMMLYRSSINFMGFHLPVELSRGKIKKVESSDNSLFVEVPLIVEVKIDVFQKERIVVKEIDTIFKIFLVEKDIGPLAIQLLQWHLKESSIKLIGTEIDLQKLIEPVINRFIKKKINREEKKINNFIKKGELPNNLISEVIDNMNLPIEDIALSIELQHPLGISIGGKSSGVILRGAIVKENKEWIVKHNGIKKYDRIKATGESQIYIESTNEILQYIPDIGTDSQKYKVTSFCPSADEIVLELKEIKGIAGDVKVSVAFEVRNENEIDLSIRNLTFENDFIQLLGSIDQVKKVATNIIKNKLDKYISLFNNYIPHEITIKSINQSTSDERLSINMNVETQNPIEIRF